MTTLTFVAEDSATALEQAARKFGDNCYILSTVKRGDKVEISATDNQLEAIGKSGKSGNRRRPKRYIDVFADAGIDMSKPPRPTDWPKAEAADKAAPKDITPTLQASVFGDVFNEHKGDAGERMVRELREMKQLLTGMVLTDEVGLSNDLGLSTPVRLRQAGFSDPLVQSLRHSYRELDFDAGRERFLAHLAAELAGDTDMLSAMTAPVLVVIGGHGAGKSLLAGKLAAHILEHGGELPVTLGELSSCAVANQDNLGKFARLLNLPVTRFDEAGFVDAVSGIGEQVIIEAGCNPESVVALVTALRDKLNRDAVQVVLALPGSSNRAMIMRQMKLFGKLKPLVALTKLDECDMTAAEFSALYESGAKLGLITGSQAMIDALAIATQPPIAQYLMENC